MLDLLDSVNRYAAKSVPFRAIAPPPKIASRQFLGTLYTKREMNFMCLSSVADYMVARDELIVVSRDTVQTICCEGGPLSANAAVPNPYPFELSCVAAKPQESVLCCSNGLACVRGQHLAPTKPLASSGHIQSILCVNITPDGAYIATGDTNGTIIVWSGDLQPLQHMSGHTEWVRFVKFSLSRSGTLHLFSAGDDGAICQWDALSGALVARLDYARGQSVQVFEVSYYTGIMAITGSRPVLALYYCLSDTSTRTIGVEVLRLEQLGLITGTHKFTPTAARFTEDARWIASAAEDETVAVTSVVDTSVFYVCSQFVTRRRCLSFMNTFTSVCILAAPPTSTVIVVAACATDGTVMKWVVDPNTNRSSYTTDLQLHIGSLLSMELVPSAAPPLL